jgi:uncharacterized protein YciI
VTAPLTVVLGTYLAPIEEVDAEREAHLAFLRGLVDEGTALMAGRRTPPEGSVIVLCDVPADAAHALLEADPYIRAGLVRYDVAAVFTPGVTAPALADLLG